MALTYINAIALFQYIYFICRACMNFIFKKKTPRPDFYRKNQKLLNGSWDFTYNFGQEDVGDIRPDFKINVPFCPESKLSGLEIDNEIIRSCYYRKHFSIRKDNDLLFLNFEAVNYLCNVYINGQKVGEHRGGYTPFGFEISKYVKTGKNLLEVYCYSDVNDKNQPSGKQCDKLELYSVFYPRVTGIWQTVWLERVPKTRIVNSFIDTSINGNVRFNLKTAGTPRSLSIEIFYKRKKIAFFKKSVDKNDIFAEIDIKSPLIWSGETPYLYDVKYILEDKKGIKDICFGYFGIREIKTVGDKFLLNGKETFLNLVLNQGYYEGGLYTPKNQSLIKKDIILAKKLGFNGARLHQKVFGRRALYYADVLGFYLWGEYPSWGFDHTNVKASGYFLPEWKETVLRDYNHPSVVAWCPLNENWEINGVRQNDDFVREVYEITKEKDHFRPCIDVSWNYHVKTDIYDVHDYTTDNVEFDKKFLSFQNGIYDSFKQKYDGQPYMLSEFGGLKFSCNNNAFGYGDTISSEAEYIEKISGFYNTIAKNKKIKGCCYTQLYDTFQEQNGILYFNRKPKLGKKSLKVLRQAIRKCEKR